MNTLQKNKPDILTEALTFEDRFRLSVKNTKAYYESLDYHLWFVENMSATSSGTYAKGSTPLEMLQDYFKNSPLERYSLTRTASGYGFKVIDFGRQILLNNNRYRVQYMGACREQSLPEEYVIELYFDKDTAFYLKDILKRYSRSLETFTVKSRGWWTP